MQWFPEEKASFVAMELNEHIVFSADVMVAAAY